MTLLKFALLWPLVGAVWQIGVHMYGRRKYGRYNADASVRFALGRWWLLKIFIACFFWPLGVYLFCMRRHLRAVGPAVDAYSEHMHDRCPDCGEPLDAEPPQ